MLEIILWYVLLFILGLIGFPVVHQLFPALADRGYSFSKSLALLAWGFIFWILSSFGFLTVSTGSALIALLIVVSISAVVGRRSGLNKLLEWFKENWRTVLTVELVFLAFFIFMGIVRAAVPEVSHTEQPMELAFINSILRSDTMPPNDPWLAGYSISYYYFGYILVALMALLTNTVGGVAFNLGLVMTFSLSALGAFGILYNLLKAYLPKLRGTLIFGVLGSIFLLFVSNVEGFLEQLHTRGIFWKEGADGTLTSGFWSWLNILDLKSQPNVPFDADMRGGWWWWRASRVIHDFSLDGIFREVISEFPAFSYVLGDLHPHVLNMPFVFLAMAFALNLILGGAAGRFKLWFIEFFIEPKYLLVAAWMMGALAFLNIWDFPMYVGFFCGAYTLILARKDGWHWGILKDFILLGLVMGIVGAVSYLPFYISFSSQAGGILPNMVFPTPGKQIWVMFGTLWIPLFAYLIWQWTRAKNKNSLLKAFGLAAGITLLLWLASILLTLFIVGFVPLLTGVNPEASLAVSLFFELNGAKNLAELINASIRLRLENPGGWITLLLLLSLAIQAVWKPEADSDEEPVSIEISRKTNSGLMVTWIIILGLGLVLVPEFIYLRDSFGYRMNTIFKFYYQAWALWSVATAFGSVVLLVKLKHVYKFLFTVVFIVVVMVGLVYPIFGFDTITNGFNPRDGWNLNGSIPNGALNPDDQAAIAWLRDAPMGVLAEALDGTSYNPQISRISTHSGMPTVIGWPGHEGQWRGGVTEMGSRMEDISRLYTAKSDQELIEILNMYNIRYVYLGNLEHSIYSGIQEHVLMRILTPVFEQGSVTIFEYETP